MIVLRADNPLHPDHFLRREPPIGLPLWMEGMLERADARAVAVVGTRKPSLYGIELARNIAAAVARHGITVVSGLARGIDTEAHRAALNAGGRTIAVLGTGLDNLYPEENIALAADIAKSGALLSQFEPGTRPLPRHFPLRNRTIALLADATIIVEAGERSGSLVTGRHAIEAGRTVHVAGGEVDAKGFRGSYEFLKKNQGDPRVRLLSSLDDLFGALPSPDAPPAAPAPIPDDLSPAARAVVEFLREHGEDAAFDEIVEHTGLPAHDLPALLLPLVIRGVVAEMPGNRYTCH